MIKSINYRANRIASIEISDESDVESLGEYGYGSTARVTGKIGPEYIYTPDGWIKTSSGDGGGSSNVLVVHGTLDMEHAESETEFPLILDKTMVEILAAEYTVLSVDVGEGFYVLPESIRTSEDDTEMIVWLAVQDDLEFVARASTNGATLEVSQTGGDEPDETDEFTIYNSAYGSYSASTTHAVSDPWVAKQAIFTFDFAYGTVAERLSGTAEARLVSIDTSDDSATLVYQAIVEQNGELWCITVTSVDNNGSRLNYVVVARHPVGPLVLHGTITDQQTMSGTVEESPADLAAAIGTNKRVIFKVMMPTDSDFMAVYVSCNVLTDENGTPAAYGTGSIDAGVFLAVYVRVNNDAPVDVLVFQAGQYTLTPYSGS